VTISERDGRPLSVGRKTRTIPSALRRALRSRDSCCRFPGCTQRRFVDAHHVHHWAHGGETKLSNLLLLCRHHHRLPGGFQVMRLPHGGTEFVRTDGRRILEPPRRALSDPGEVRARNERTGLGISADTPAALSGGSRFSLDLAVTGLLARDPPH
jgi:HNH endonuclease